MLIDPDAFEAGFTAWVGSLVNRFEPEVVAIEDDRDDPREILTQRLSPPSSGH